MFFIELVDNEKRERDKLEEWMTTKKLIIKIAEKNIYIKDFYYLNIV